jgi:thiosulfate reductase cytochrome b subunit
MEKLAYRHNRITRTTHWINALALVILVMSGFQIFNAHPRLYWGSRSEPDEAFLSIAATNVDGVVRGFFKIYGWQFDTTGVLGTQNTDMGPVTRAFPSWLTIPGYFWLAGGRRWHFFFAWIFALNGLLYIIYNVANGHIRKFLPGPRDLARVPAMALYYLRIRKESPQQDEYNPLQMMAYTSVFFILTPLVILSGMAMSPQLNMGINWLPAVFGGRQSARSIHFILTFLFAGFTFGHVLMVLTTGVLNNMRSMITGWYREKHPEPESVPLQDSGKDTIEQPAQVSAPTVDEESPVPEEHSAPPQLVLDDHISTSESSDAQPLSGLSSEPSAPEKKEAKKDVGE